MSWSRGRALVLAARAAGLMAVAVLGGCGFHPLYGTTSRHGEAVAGELAAIRIPPVVGQSEAQIDRLGQILRNNLSDRLTPKGQSAQKRYSLAINIDRQTQELGIRRDATASRANLMVSANYTLTGVSDNVVRVSGASRTVVSYDILDAQFATTVAEKDAEHRAVRELADDIANRLALYFSAPPNTVFGPAPNSRETVP